MQILNEWNSTCTPPWELEELEYKVQQARDRSTLPLGYMLENGAQ
jgi:hypothetical protein